MLIIPEIRSVGRVLPLPKASIDKKSEAQINPTKAHLKVSIIRIVKELRIYGEGK